MEMCHNKKKTKRKYLQARIHSRNYINEKAEFNKLHQPKQMGTVYDDIYDDD